MYMRRMLSVGKAENGFVVECMVPIKRKKGETDKEPIEYPCNEEKQYIVKDETELTDLIRKLVPMLDDEFSSEEEFNMAFDKAVKTEKPDRY